MTDTQPKLPPRADQEVYEVTIRMRVPALPGDYQGDDIDTDEIECRAFEALRLDSPDDIEVEHWGSVNETSEVTESVWHSRGWIADE